MEKIEHPETSVRNYHYFLLNNSEECSSDVKIIFIFDVTPCSLVEILLLFGET
jgi:hypothetical protein